MKTKVSVIVTVLNEATTIKQLMVSLLAQTYRADEIIIVDGGSKDETLQYLQSVSLKSPQITVLTKKGNRSLGRNLAISRAKNEVIAITDAGCLPHPDWLEKLVAKYQATKAPVVAGYYDAKPETLLQAAVVPYVLVMPDRVNEATFLPATRSMLIEKSAWQSVKGFDESLSDNEDYAFAHALHQQGFKIVMAREALVMWMPRSSLGSFFYMIFRFARGDIKAGIVRPKVILVFARYGLFLVAILTLVLLQQWLLLLGILIGHLLLYSCWAISKNYRYVPQGWYWLPILQHLADVGVLLGSVAGVWQRVTR